jgi:hypothetical protein
VATLPFMTLSELRTAARQRGDFIGDAFISDSELNSYLNESLYGLYDLLVSSWGADYFVEEYEFTTTTAETYALPSDFYKLLGVDLQVTTGADGWITILPFNITERNRNSVYGTAGVPRWYNALRYRLRKNSLWLTPQPQSGQTLRLLYVPRMVPLADPTTLTLAVGENMVDGQSIIFRDEDGVAIDTLTAGDDFEVGSDAAATAENLFDAISNAIGSVAGLATLEAEYDDNVTITFTLTADTYIEVQSTSSDVTLSRETVYFPTETDGYSGWLEYVIVDAARKMKLKQEDDTSAFERELEMLRQRVIQMAPDRDAGSPATITDVRRGTAIGGGPGFGGGGWDGGAW